MHTYIYIHTWEACSRGTLRTMYTDTYIHVSYITYTYNRPIYIYIHVSYINIYMYIHTYIIYHIHEYTSTHIIKLLCVYTYMNNTCIHKHKLNENMLQTDTSTYMHTYIYAYMHTYMHTYIQVNSVEASVKTQKR